MGVAELVRITSPVGTTYQNPSAMVTVMLGNSANNGLPVYTLQPAGTLRETGQHGPYDKQYINVSLEQIAESLTKNLAYSAMQRATFFTDESGRILKDASGNPITRFRHHLMVGLWNLARQGKENLPFLAELSQEELDGKIFGKGNARFSSFELGAMADAAHQYVKVWHEVEGTYQINADGVKKWLSGEVNGPRERDVFYALREVNPVFSTYLSAAPGQDSPWDAYKHWTIVRQGLRHWFEAMKGEGTSWFNGRQGRDEAESVVTEGCKGTRLGGYALWVLNGIAEPISTQHVNVPLSAKHVRIPLRPNQSLENAVEEAEQGTGGPKPHLYLGLCNEKAENLPGTVIPYSDLPALLYLTSQALRFAVHRYLSKAEGDAQLTNVIKAFELGDVVSEEKPSEIRSFFATNIAIVLAYYGRDDFVSKYVRHIENKLLDAVRAMARLVHRESLDENGQFDAYLGLKKGATAAAITFALNCTAALPEEFFEATAKSAESFGLALRTRPGEGGDGSQKSLKRSLEEKTRELSRLEVKLQDQYGLAFAKMLLSDVAVTSSVNNDPYELVYDRDFMATAGLFFGGREKPTGFYTYKEAKKLLEAAGMEEILKLIPPLAFIDQAPVTTTAWNRIMKVSRTA